MAARIIIVLPLLQALMQRRCKHHRLLCHMLRQLPPQPPAQLQLPLRKPLPMVLSHRSRSGLQKARP